MALLAALSVAGPDREASALAAPGDVDGDGHANIVVGDDDSPDSPRT